MGNCQYQASTIKPLWRRNRIRSLSLVSGLLLISSANTLQANDRLETLEISGNRTSQTFVDTLSDLNEQLATIPGGTNLIQLPHQTSTATLSDALGNQPGIVVQEFFGGLDQPRLNIRGSGLQANPVSRGVLLRENHLPINEADGSFIMGTLDLQGSEAIAVSRGANSRALGSTTLGGDLNFITLTNGKDLDRISVSSGSFSQQNFAIQHQRLEENYTYQLGFTEASSEGYRHHSAAKRSILRGGIAWQNASGLSNQSFFRISDIHFDMPFVLTRERAASDPESVYGDGGELFDIGLNMYRRDPHRTVTQKRFTNRTIFSHGNFDHTLGIYWQETEDAFVDPMSHIETKSELKGWQYAVDHYATDFFHYQIGFDAQESTMPRRYTGNNPLSGEKLGNYASFDLTAENQSASVIFDLRLFPQWTLTGQWQQTTARRTGHKRQDQSRLNKQWRYNTNKIGIIYELDNFEKEIRFFANVSQSKEVPTYWELIGTSLNPILTYLSEADFLDLDLQEATTIEIGGSLQQNNTTLDATLYRSQLDKELMSTASQYGVIANSINYQGTTIHQGAELGIRGSINPINQQLIYQCSWNYSDFYFDDGPFSGNQIAGIPEHIIGAEIRYEGEVISFGPTLTWIPQKQVVDHTNTLYEDGYILYGLKTHFRFKPFLQAFITISNLTDVRYNSSFVIREASNPDLPTFLPGNGRSLLAGVTLQLPH